MRWYNKPVYPLCYSVLSESSETESDALKLKSQSEEFLPTPLSSASNESFFGDGMQLLSLVHFGEYNKFMQPNIVYPAGRKLE